MPYKNFGNEVLTSSDVNNYLMRQAVIRVANGTELDAIPTPVAGMMATRADNGITYRHNGSSWVRMMFNTGAMIQAGTVSTSNIPAGTSAWTDVATVTFATPFSSAPTVVLTNYQSFAGADPVMLAMTSISTTSFGIQAKCASSKSAQLVHWIATARTQ
ncbi:gp53-like domain-containing protein [Demequina litorisediminis]|uniref:H-type lectin domain-containing protein n=1 Tax=Demequina litorisediminis TaxID=1849022 RepID=A0ABQ6ICL6_9MICO|nr:H-type lectin domain-containing protein [Demequina litorisediminis]GMA34747.1 hypothetical protein GCM10025876_09510 [Demequina litorisediminis]